MSGSILCTSFFCNAMRSGEIIGTKVVNAHGFHQAAQLAIRVHDTSKDRVPGQHVIECPELIPFVSAGVGRRTEREEDYVSRKGRFGVALYLKREHAAAVEACRVVVYTREAMFADPDMQKTRDGELELSFLRANPHVTHMLIAVLADAGPRSPLTPQTLVHNLAGGNNEALLWTAEEIRAKAAESEAYWNEWCVVAG